MAAIRASRRLARAPPASHAAGFGKRLEPRDSKAGRAAGRPESSLRAPEAGRQRPPARPSARSGTRWWRSGRARSAPTPACASDLSRALQALQHRLLHQVLGLVERAQHPVAVRHQLAAVRLEVHRPIMAHPWRVPPSAAPGPLPTERSLSTTPEGLTWEPSQRWVRAGKGGSTVVDSRHPCLVWEPDLPVPQYAFPRADAPRGPSAPRQEPAHRAHTPDRRSSTISKSEAEMLANAA